MALAGCAATGVQPVTEASRAPISATVSPAMTQLAGAIEGETRTRLEQAGSDFAAKHCDVELQRSAATSEFLACSQTRRELGRYADELLDQVSWAMPWPAEVDDVAGDTTTALRAVSTAAKGADPKQVTLALSVLQGALAEWSTVLG